MRKVNDVVVPDRSGLQRYVAGEHMDTDSLHIRRWGTVGDGYLGPAFHMRFRQGHVLYGSRRTYLRKVAVADFDGITANTTFVLEPKDPKVLMPALLPFIMQTDAFATHSVEQSKGSVNPYVNFSDLARFEFVLPSLEAQQQIVATLSAVEEAVDSFFRLASAADRAYQSCLVGTFGAAVGERDDSPDESANEWKWKRVDQCFELQLGKMSSKQEREGSDKASYIKNTNVLWGRFALSNLPEMRFDQHERTKFSLRPGDLLVCEGGEIGRAAVWVDVGREVFFQKALHRLRPLDASASTRFFLHYLRYCAVAGILKRITTGTTIAHLPRERLAALDLPFPDRPHQDAITSLLDRVVALAAFARERMAALKTIKLRVLDGRLYE